MSRKVENTPGPHPESPPKEKTVLEAIVPEEAAVESGDVIARETEVQARLEKLKDDYGVSPDYISLACFLSIHELINTALA